MILSVVVCTKKIIHQFERLYDNKKIKSEKIILFIGCVEKMKSKISSVLFASNYSKETFLLAGLLQLHMTIITFGMHWEKSCDFFLFFPKFSHFGGKIGKNTKFSHDCTQCGVSQILSYYLISYNYRLINLHNLCNKKKYKQNIIYI